MTNRLERLMTWLPSDWDGALVELEVHRRYLTGFHSSAGMLVVTREKSVLVVDGRYVEAASGAVTHCEVRLGNRMADWLPALAEELSLKRILCESGISVASYQALQTLLPQAELVSDGSLDRQISEQRTCKEPQEIAAIKEAQRLTDQAFSHILNFIRPGVLEREIALELEFTMRRLGAQKESFETIAVSGPRGSLPHGVPGEKPVQASEFITMDFGAVVDGYHSDMTRTVALGQVSEEQKRVYDTVLQAQRSSLAMLKAGVTGAAADAAARDVITAAGYGDYFDHSTGHGVGLEIHESPSLAPRYGQPRKAGQVVTVEPGIYLPGRFGVRIEDFGLITQDGFENFTRSPKELICL